MLSQSGAAVPPLRDEVEAMARFTARRVLKRNARATRALRTRAG
jgi:hypothetical protein